MVFTSGGTEADNLAVAGVHGARPGRVLCSAVEHEAVLGPVARVGGRTVPVDADGVVDLDALDDLLDARHDARVGDGGQQRGRHRAAGGRGGRAWCAAGRRGAAVHTDAVQAAAWLPLADRLGRHRPGQPQLPQGRRSPGRRAPSSCAGGTPLRPLVAGGGQERELRSGTHNVAGIVGFAAALRAAAAARDADGGRHAAPGATAWPTGCSRPSPAWSRPARPAPTACPALCHVCLPGVESEALLFLLDEAGVCASAASACASGAQQASHVLAAMGVPPDRAAGRCACQPRLDHHRRRRRPRPRGRPGGRRPPAGGGGVKVLVAMSGGVDSSVAAARLLAGGHEVVGVTMKLWGGESDTGCCSVSDVDDARRVAQQLGVAHHVWNFGDEFEARVVGPVRRRPPPRASRPTRASSATAT